MTTLTPIACEPGAGEHLWFFGGLTTIKADGDATGGRVMVTEQLAPRGSGSPLHVHHNEDEWFYVLDGELTIWVDGQTVVAPAGAVSMQVYAQTVKNFPDAKGETVLDAQASALLAVYSERAGWLEVEPASGMKVWVHGSFVKRTTTPGVVEITANNVRMRPLPSSDEKSFPLPSKLDKGEREPTVIESEPEVGSGDSAPMRRVARR